jgi:transcriptional regulator with XRE-family HTH domain
MTTLSDRLRGARTSAGISLRKLDELAGLHPGHSAQIERNPERSVETRTVRQLASVFAATEQERELVASWLAFGTGSAPSASQLEMVRARSGAKPPSTPAAESGPTVDRSGEFAQAEPTDGAL